MLACLNRSLPRLIEISESIASLAICIAFIRRGMSKPSSHGAQQLRARVRSSPGTLGNADRASRQLRECGNALIEVHKPALHSSHHLLLLGDGAWRTRSCAYLAVL